MTTIHATRTVASEATDVYAFLAELENHWSLAHRAFALVRLHGPPGARTGGEIELRGPLGFRRMASTRLEPTDDPLRIVGRAQVASGTTARVTWSLTGLASGTHVELTAEVLNATARDRLLLALGRPWLRRRFADTIDQLERHAA